MQTSNNINKLIYKLEGRIYPNKEDCRITAEIRAVVDECERKLQEREIVLTGEF